MQIESSEPVSKLMEMVEVLSQLAPAQQRLLLNSKEVSLAQTLTAAGIVDGDLLEVLPKTDPLALNPDGSAAYPESFLAALRQEPAMLNQLTSLHPALGQAVTTGDHETMQNVLRQVMSASTTPLVRYVVGIIVRRIHRIRSFNRAFVRTLNWSNNEVQR
jgi:hypothetical protein